ncbi:phage tail protein [Pseudoalteromonas umbrosa]|uniref:phage tail protein n=1 Tax=Pseudoalteromonas umbrosa TaxID=3048489 RepID=UPI0024C259F7|nr:phage tail protein [Pseudoalteromonas sp. B95]MDK1287359.1 phage tail protein [Pseudoalteromonas sp. B95]
MAKINHANYMMQLGEYKFSVSTAAFQKLQFNTEYRWKDLESQTDKNSPVKQFIGVGEQTLELDGTIFPQLVENGLKQLDFMREEATKGVPLTLTYVEESGKSSPSVGRVLGKWVIKSINETRTLFLNDGIPREIQFSMSLSRYDGNEGNK